MRKYILLFIVVLGWLNQPLNAQVNVRDSAVQGFIFNFSFGGYINGGDVSQLYGGNMALGMDIWYKTRTNWLIGGGASYLFGNEVKDQATLFSSLLTESGNIIGVDGDYADVKVYQRGFTAMAKVGKVFPFFGPNPNSGAFFQLGVGYIQHKTLIENKSQSVPQILGEYTKGYDRLHGGVVLNEFIGLYYSGNKRTTNFTVGLDFQQGFTSNYREYNYGSRQYDTDTKIDLFFGLKASWFLPIYDKNAQKYYYY